MIPVAGLLSVVPVAPIVARTFALPSVDAFGRVVPGAATETPETVPVHTATSRQRIEHLKEADRHRETIAVYVYAGSALAPSDATSPAEIDYRGHTYTVAAIGDYDTQGAVHLVLAQR